MVLNEVLTHRGAAPTWDAYLDAVYGSKTLRYPINTSRLNWLYWSAPITQPIWIYSQPVAGADAFVSHFAPLGFTLVRGRTNEPALRRADGSLWMEVMREDKSRAWEDATQGFWYYEARGSGIWTALGRFVDYSCTEASSDQSLRPQDKGAYERTCKKHGLAVMRTDSTRLHVGGTFAATRGVSLPAQEFAQFSRSERRYGVSHRPRGFDTVIRWFGYDLQNGLNASGRRELIDILQNNSWCRGETSCRKGKPRCCSCMT